MCSKPPLGGGLGPLCVAKVAVHGCSVPAEVVFLGHRTSLGCLKLTVSGWTVNMQSPFIKTLPERCSKMQAHMSPDVDVFHFLALAFSIEIKDVEVFEVSSEGISKIDTFYWVAACCSPVGGVGLQ